ncbi:hypothetical protein C8Q73DRAFT_693636 [Cubamyces lactineus]|nr:hypothetical protein C8Q73DRAFT_693636 [Cubamyces lactineus]
MSRHSLAPSSRLDPAAGSPLRPERRQNAAVTPRFMTTGSQRKGSVRLIHPSTRWMSSPPPPQMGVSRR